MSSMTTSQSAAAQGQTQIKPPLGFWDSIAINIGIMIGVGIFRVPADVARQIPSAPLILLAWVLGPCFALLGVLCFRALAAWKPQSGGAYVYLREAFGRPMAFLFAWTDITILRTASIAAVAFILADYLKELFAVQNLSSRAVAGAAIVAFTAINLIGLKLSAGLQRWLTVFKVALLACMVLLIFAWPRPETLHVGNLLRVSGSCTVLGFLAALIPVLWVCGGWHESTFVAGEFKDNKRMLGRSLIASVLIVGCLYLAANAAYLLILDPRSLGSYQALASDVMGSLLGDKGRIFVSAAIIVSAAGALNATILAGGRIPYVVGQDISKLKRLGQETPRVGTPARSIALIGLWSLCLAAWGSFEQLLFFSGFAYWLFFALVGIGLIRVRSRMSMPRYVLPAAMAFSAGCMILCLTTIISFPKEAAIGAGLVAAGGIAYFFLRDKAKAR